MTSATRVSDGVDDDLYYIASDHLGSTTVVADAEGNEVGHTIYTPYGSILTSTLSLTVTDRALYRPTLGCYNRPVRLRAPAVRPPGSTTRR
jgi:hypothetical protein